jgi:hypothetical protein
MVGRLRSDSYDECLKELSMTTREERRHHHHVQQTHKILHGLNRVDRKTWFSMVS